ncbi:MAG: bifunctional phosphopantothenoylcysteine decarboxylase/phosphopantothenate--cysteine ligase CoaBC [Thermoplasmatota archaeon]
MHPIANIRGSASKHLVGKRIVLGVTGSIAAVKTVELARELTRHGAEVHAVMTKAACDIVHPNALQFGTGNPVITKLTGAVEHVALLGDVPEKADLLLIAPCTANTVGKIVYGIDDTTVTTCATVALGTGTPIVCAPAMHDAMMHHPKVEDNIAELRKLGVTWVEPKVEEKKAKLADIDHIVDAVIAALATQKKGKRCLVIGGATAEPVDDVRVLTNRSSGKTAAILAKELGRAGAEVELWMGHHTTDLPHCTTHHFQTHAELMQLAEGTLAFDEIWMPAAIADYTPERTAGKIPSEQDDWTIIMQPVEKVIEWLRVRTQAKLIAFKAEATEDGLVEKARARLERYSADAIVANAAASFGADQTRAFLVTADQEQLFEGSKQQVMTDIVAAL